MRADKIPRFQPEFLIWGLIGAAWLAMAHHWFSPHGTNNTVPIARTISNFAIMTMATMLPLVMKSVHTTAMRSYRRRRGCAMLLFTLGFLATWTAAGAPAILVSQAAARHGDACAALSFAIAALWARTALRRRGLVGCHRTVPLAPTGWRASYDAAAFGATIGRSCVLSCWPLMLACTVSNHGILAVFGSTAINMAERRSFRSSSFDQTIGSLGLASGYAIWSIIAT